MWPFEFTSTDTGIDSVPRLFTDVILKSGLGGEWKRGGSISMSRFFWSFCVMQISPRCSPVVCDTAFAASAAPAAATDNDFRKYRRFIGSERAQVAGSRRNEFGSRTGSQHQGDNVLLRLELDSL